MITACISHKEDVDGIVSASLIKSLFKGHPFLVDYSDFISILEGFAKMQDVERLFICDLGLSKSNENKFIKILSSLRKKGVEVVYIDHHDLADEVKDTLRKNEITIIHTVNECTSVQIYDRFGDKLPRRFMLLTVCAAIADDMNDRSVASKLCKAQDKQLSFFEATSLSFAIYANQHNPNFLISLVSTLTTAMPHEVVGVLDSAKSYAQKITTNLDVIERNTKRMKNLVHVQTYDLSTSITANILLATYQDVQTAVAYKEKNGSYVLSIRGSDSSNHHLGRIVNKLSVELGGSGGGHEKACGALIPKTKLDEFMENVDSILS